MTPIKDWSKYPKNWIDISQKVRALAGGKCELCRAAAMKSHPVTKSLVVLTVHHIDGDPSNNDAVNLIALCQRCHLRLDQPYKSKRRREERNAGSQELFG